jgi:hypothetical protein
MTPLAEAVYEILRKRCPQTDPRITYAKLAEELREVSNDFEYVHHRGRELYKALSEVGRACRRLKLPPLPALVVRVDTRRPGAAYYGGKCTGMVHHGDQIAAWGKDFEAVRNATYPAKLARRIKTGLEPSV